MNETKQQERDRLCKEFMEAIDNWVYSDRPLNDEFREMTREYKEKIEKLEEK